MTITMKNVDTSLFEVLKSLIKLRNDVEIIQQTDDDEVSYSSENNVQKINAVLDKIPDEEQLAYCDVGIETVREALKNDSW